MGRLLMKLTLPKSLLELTEKDREAIIAVLLEASHLPKVKNLPRSAGDEHNMWTRNADTLLAREEDRLFDELAEEELNRIVDFMGLLGLPTDVGAFRKSIEPEYFAFEEELIKAKSGRSRMSDIIQTMGNVAKKKREQFVKWTQDGKAFTKEQLKQMDKILSSKLPDYAKVAEQYMIRAGFIGKIRNQAERENFETLGAYIDRFPSTVEAVEKEGVILTLKQKAKAEAKGEKVKVLPLTTSEAEAVKHASLHAGDKMTDISTRHMAGVRQLVIQAKKERWSAQELAQKLFDKFGEHNRDWRRVAITELAFATNDAYLSGIEEGETVIGMGAENACKYCKQYVIGKQFTVTHNPPLKDTYESDMKLVWAGKTNYGRKVAEYRPAIPCHPNCRCRYHRISRFYKLGKDGKLELKSTEELINEERAKRGLKPDTSLQGLSDEDRLRKLTENFLKKQ